MLTTQNNDLAERDTSLAYIESQIEAKRHMLLEKQKKLKEASKENEFLQTVRQDYQKYYDHIVQEKKDQLRAMGLLKKYVDDLVITGKLTDADVKNAKADQTNLLKEVGVIKKELDSLIDE
jgi:hypothetical protein